MGGSISSVCRLHRQGGKKFTFPIRICVVALGVSNASAIFLKRW